MPFLTGIENEVVKSHYLRKLAKVLNVDAESVLIEAEKIYQKQFTSSPVVSSPVNQATSSRREILETYLLGLIFSVTNPRKYLTLENKKLFESHRWTRIFSLARKFSKKSKFDPGKFLNLLPDELKPKFEEIFIAQKEEEEPENEINNVILEIKKTAIKEELNQLSLEISKAEKQNDQETTIKMEKKFSLKAQKLVELSHNE